MTKLNPLFLNDVYKHGHADFYNPKTTKIYSTFTPRKSRVNGVDKVVVFGLQYLVKKYLIEDFNDNFFNKPEEEVVKDYLKIINNITGDNGIGEERIRKLHQLGYLPVKICSLEEGELCPIKVPMLTIENTLPEFYWVTNFLETLICNTLWMPCTSATTSLQYRKVLDKWAEKTCDNNNHVDYQAHDFSLRSMSCMEAGTISGLAHLLSFKGTDTIPAVICAEQYYNSNSDIEDIGHSINATEHSVQETNILFNNYENKEEGEYLNLLQILEQMGPESNFSYVADTYNLWDCITKVLPRLKDEILGRKSKLVIRPDCYDDKTQILTENGWKYFKDLNKYVDKVAQYHEDGTIDFVIPLKYYSEYYEGDMYKFSNLNHNLDLFVTPNHRMVYRNQKTGKLNIQFAENIKYFSYRNSIHAGKKIGNVDKLTPKEKLLIAIQADGRFRYGDNSSKFIVDFQFAKKRKIDRLINICNEGGFKYKIVENSRMFNNSNKNWSNQSTIYVYLDEKPFKNFSEWVSLEDKSYLWCKEFIHEVVQWDGCVRSNYRYKYDSTEQSNAEIVQMIAILAGYRTKYSVYNDNRSKKFRNTHTVNILTNRDYLDGQSIIKKLEKYSGNVYCVQVPTGLLVVRRNGQVSISGNSGNPCDIICGINTKTFFDPYRGKEKTEKLLTEKDSEYYESINKGVIELLWDIFGGTINSKGYKVLNPHIGCIYGDGITLERAEEICARLEAKGFASSNIVFGIGGYSFQYVTRDTFGFALKTTYGEVDNKELLLFKDPITDDGEKKSQKGLVLVCKDNDDNIVYLDELTQEFKQRLHNMDLLKPLFVDGKLVRETSLAEIRNRLTQV